MDGAFDESYHTSLAYKYQMYCEALLTCPEQDVVLHKYTNEQTGDIMDMYVPNIRK